MGKDKEIRIKANGLRNELKEINKSIIALTNAILATNARTNENIKIDWTDCPLYSKLHASLCECGEQKDCSCKDA